ncbi:type II toxin-antitoxin system Phd/YefM family antitoxin [Devosia naphthalenivorans]|uniref:type II toxin-antitoxin system Phd/YefM family antitoxin n=1 Tax=Devosia naphthalenivorans TaxID=2082392 RepID=UPI000D391C31|nr:type II toxin-antitoxin system Phd/YefM family antitoxin [Devosia naphthalenivorans]
MQAVPASEVAKNFGEWHDKALIEPVLVSKYGRESVVLISVETYRALLRNYREVVDTSELDDLVANGIESSEIPEQYRWSSEDDDVTDERRGAGR